MSRRPLIAGNWKMHGLRADGMALVEALLALAGDSAQRFDLMICPPATLIDRIATRLQGSTLQLGAQNCNAAASGAFTGDIAAPMLQDLGVGHVIVGHSERRAGHHETDAMVKAKAEAVLTAGMTPILCVGETHAERQAGQALAVVGRQLEASWPDHAAAAPMVVAYEPIWAIGSGVVPSHAEVQQMHSHLRNALAGLIGDAAASVRLLYGGSMKPDNAAPLLALPDVDGGLIGGASLDAKSFWAIALASPGADA